MIYGRLRNLAFGHTKGQIFRSAQLLQAGARISAADSEPAAPIISPVLHLPYVNQSGDLQVLLIGSAERWGQLKIWECVLLTAFEPQTLEVFTGQSPPSAIWWIKDWKAEKNAANASVYGWTGHAPWKSLLNERIRHQERLPPLPESNQGQERKEMK